MGAFSAQYVRERFSAERIASRFIEHVSELCRGEAWEGLESIGCPGRRRSRCGGPPWNRLV